MWQLAISKVTQSVRSGKNCKVDLQLKALGSELSRPLRSMIDRKRGSVGTMNGQDIGVIFTGVRFILTGCRYLRIICTGELTNGNTW